MVGTSTAGDGGADDLNIATTGQTGITIRSGTGSGGQIFFADGTSGDDRQRGIISYQHGGNYMRFYTDALERFRITSDGKFGLNTTAPYAYDTTATTFEVKGSVASAADTEVARFRGGSDANGGTAVLRLTNDNDRGLVVKGGRESDAEFAEFGTSSFNGTYTRGIRIDSSGNVGVNNTNPAAYGKFVVTGTSNVISLNASSGAGSLSFFENGTGRFYLKTLNGSDGLAFVDADGSSERLRITSTGKLIISTNTATTAEFDYAGVYFSSSSNSTVAEGLFINNVGAGTGDNASISFSGDSGNRKKSALSHVRNGNYGRGDLTFSIDPDADSGHLDVTAHEKLRITSGGQVRIGNANNLSAWGQNNRLQVAGTDWSGSGITIANMNSANICLLYTSPSPRDRG